MTTKYVIETLDNTKHSIIGGTFTISNGRFKVWPADEHQDEGPLASWFVNDIKNLEQFPA